MEHPAPGESFLAKVDRISDSGNGIIETNDRFINVGPISEDSVGEKIKIKMVNSRYGFCLTEKYTETDYRERFEEVSNIDGLALGDDNAGDVFQVKKRGDLRFIEYNGEEYHFKWLDRTRVKVGRKAQVELYKNEYGKFAKLVSADPSEFDETSEITPTVEVDSNLTPNDDPEEKSDSTDIDELELSSRTDSHDENSGQTQANRTSANNTQRLDHLREQAEKAAVEDIPKNSVATRPTSQQYSRSREVRQYVMARADGVCEGCEQPAPFRSKTGEPYLHAHHIFELATGGHDTPDTVIALCPNCHYRVHHGEDGDEYNQNLKQKLETIEGQHSEE
jgi:hypothetical protein